MGWRRIPHGVAVFLVLAGVFLLATGRERPYGDARIMYEVAQSLQRGTVAISTEWQPMSHKGPDGKVYSQYAILPSLAHLPGRMIHTGLWGTRDDNRPGARLTLVLTSHVAPALAAALACALLFAVSSLLAGSRSALVATAAVAFGSFVFVYGRYPMSEAIQAACVMGLVYELVRIVRGDHEVRRGIALGFWVGAIVNAKSVLVLGAVGGVIAAALLVRERAALRRLASGAVAGGLPWLVLLLTYNHVRWGSPLDTGYGETLAMMQESIPTGLLGLLLSPGKGLLWFSPMIVLSVIALVRSWRTHRDLVIVVLCVVVPPLVFYARFLSWSGDYAWGPRYLVFAIAPLSITLAPWLERESGRLRRWLVRVVIATSVVIQLLGASLFWDHWIRLSKEARQEWLGRPNRQGAVIAEAGRGHCDSCFEDMFGHQWLPPFSPIAGHRWLLGHLAAGDSWDTAQQDAPWRRYTSLALRSPRGVYDQVRLDWWALDIEEGNVGIAIGYLSIATTMALAGLLLHRRRRIVPPPPGSEVPEIS